MALTVFWTVLASLVIGGVLAAITARALTRGADTIQDLADQNSGRIPVQVRELAYLVQDVIWNRTWISPDGSWIREKSGARRVVWGGYQTAIILERSGGFQWRAYRMDWTDYRTEDASADRVELTDGPQPRESAFQVAEGVMNSLANTVELSRSGSRGFQNPRASSDRR